MQIFILTYLTYEILTGFSTCYVEGFIVMGCYWTDNNNGMIAFQKTTAPEHTTVSCLGHCTTFLYVYVATKLDASGTFECYCGNDIQFTTLVSGSQCEFPCPISVRDMCGRYNRIAVYDIRGESLPIKIPTAEHTTEVSTSRIEHTTEVYTSTVDRLSTTSALKVMTSLDNNKTIKTIENEKTSTVSPFVKSSEVRSTVAELQISITTRNLIRDTMFTKSTSSTSAAEGISSYSNYSNPSTSNQMQCMCPCSTVSHKWNFLANTDMSTVELKIFLNEYLNELKRNLTIDQTKTSAYLNRKLSAPDNRKSSMSIGYFGLFLVGIPLVLIVCSDAMRFVMQFQQ